MASRHRHEAHRVQSTLATPHRPQPGRWHACASSGARQPGRPSQIGRFSKCSRVPPIQVRVYYTLPARSNDHCGPGRRRAALIQGIAGALLACCPRAVRHRGHKSWHRTDSLPVGARLREEPLQHLGLSVAPIATASGDAVVAAADHLRGNAMRISGPGRQLHVSSQALHLGEELLTAIVRGNRVLVAVECPYGNILDQGGVDEFLRVRPARASRRGAAAAK